MEPRSRASQEQFSALIEFMERHGDLSRPQAGAQGRLRGERLWLQLTSLLNSIGGGVQKTQDKWKKVWADWKTKTKKKYMQIRRHACGTGGGPSSRQTLTVLEERVVAVIGVSAVVGQAGIQEQGFNTSSQPSEEPTIEGEGSEVALVLEVPHVNASPISSPPGPPASTPPPPPAVAIRPSPPPLPPPPHTPPPSTSRAASASLRSAAGIPRRRLQLIARGSTSPPPPAVATRPSPPPPPPRTPPPSTGRPASASPRSAAATPRRRLQLRARRTRGPTPFDRAASEFVAVEQRRLQLEEARERHLHEREIERLRLESQRIEATREHNQLLRQLSVIAQRLLDTLSQHRPSSLPSTDTLPDTE